ncbi:MAG: glycoside hydrolase family 20 zincin-like fold domain-containing protein, partial [Puia sp.]
MKMARAGFVLIICALLIQHVQAQSLDLSAAKIVCLTANKSFLLRTPVVLQEEIQKRTGIRLTVTNKKTSSTGPAIMLIDANDLSGLSENQRKALAALASISAEGYQLAETGADRTVLISGKDPRGLLYGVGYLLRKLEMRPGRVELKGDISMASNPFYPLRGHQLGYRPKT